VGLLITLVNTVFTILYWLIIIRVIISWVRPGFADERWRKILTFIYDVTEPILAPIRRLIPTGNIGLDFSPFIALLALNIIKNFLIRLLFSI